MKPWERRLSDLSQALANCASSYFDPETFRRNVNHFLTTARTVTFLIKKDKAQIPDFDSWYAAHVEKPWGTDGVMRWAKDARNVIEKEGDLELNSKLTIALFFGYLEETDIKIELGDQKLIYAGVTKLVRFARKSFPTRVERDAVVKIERRWITSSLPSWELLRALMYVYRRIRECCAELAVHLNVELDTSAMPATEEMADDASMAEYVKLSTGETFRVGADPLHIDESFSPPPELLEAFVPRKTGSDYRRLKTLKEVVDYFSGTARATFSHFGSHIFILALFGEQWRLASMMSVQFADQADKYIFWRAVGERVRMLRAHGLVWIGESWVREAEMMGGSVRKGKILGEHLSVTGVDRDGNVEHVVWEIKRSLQEEKATLEPLTEKESFDGVGTYLVPALRAMGIPDSSPVMPRYRY
jgi:hypothetical protein